MAPSSPRHTQPHPRGEILAHLFQAPLTLPPMAGGPSSPELVAAVTATGAAGYLAGGLTTAAQLAEDFRAAVKLRDEATANLTADEAPEPGVIGVNLFVPDSANTAIGFAARSPQARKDRRASVLAFRDELSDDAAQLGVELPSDEQLDPGVIADELDQDWFEKLDLAVSEGWPVVTFTFGLPQRDVFQHLQDAGIAVGVTVTSREEARNAVAHGADFLIVQGPEAGGHRSFHNPATEPADPETNPELAPDLTTLVATIRLEVEHHIPLVAAGGVSTYDDIQRFRLRGADTVACGTAFLLANEAGTSAVHRKGLTELAPVTATTRAFSGRVGRGVVNAFMENRPEAPAAYPDVNRLTAPLRHAAATTEDPQWANLWAGTGVEHVRAESATRIAQRLLFGQ